MSQRFSHTQYPVNALVEQIDSGELSLPDLQRPFVWKMTQVRDLFDSLYHGYPAGYFLFWSTPVAVDNHKLASAPGSSSALKLIVDGQQRLTSLYSVIKNREVITSNNELRPISISFNPLTEEFAVTDAARENDPEWVTSVSAIWAEGVGGWKFTNDFIKTLGSNRELTDDEQRRIGEALGNLQALRSYRNSQHSSCHRISILTRWPRYSSGLTQWVSPSIVPTSSLR